MLAISLVLVGLFCLGANGLYSKGSPVEMLTAADFKSKVVDGKELWMIEFFASWCGHCKSLAPEYAKAAKALSGIVRVGAVEDKAVMQQFGITGFPTLKWFGENKKSPADYNGERSAKGIVDYAVQQASSIAKARLGGGGGGGADKKKGGKSEVIVLTDKNFDDLVTKDEDSVWFVEFYAPWCGHCKSLVPAWEEVGTDLKGKIKIGKVDATVERGLASRFKVEGFPSLKLFPKGEKKPQLVQEYAGSRTASDMKDWALKYFNQRLEATQLLSNEQFKEECSKGLCVVAFLPHILDSQSVGRKAYLKEYQDIVKSSVTMPVRFYWTQGGDSFDLEEQLHLAFGYPAVIALNTEKAKYAVHRGGFDASDIRQFLTGLMSGVQPVDPLPTPLKEFEKVKKWDGKDAPVDSDDDAKDEL